MVKSIDPDGLVAVRHTPASPVSPTHRARWFAQKRPQLTAGMRLVSVRGENGCSDMNKLGFKDGSERFRTAGRPVTLTLRPEPEPQPRLRPQPEPEPEPEPELVPERRQHAQQNLRQPRERQPDPVLAPQREPDPELRREPDTRPQQQQQQQQRRRRPHLHHRQRPEAEAEPEPEIEIEIEPERQTETEAAQMAAQVRARLAAQRRQNPTTDPRPALEVEPEPEPELDDTGSELELQPEAALKPEPIFGPLVIGVDGCSPQQAEGWLEYRIDDQEEWTMGYFAISVGMMAEMMASMPETGSRDPTATMMATMARSRAHGQRMGNLGQLWLYTKQDRAKCVRVWSLAGMDVRNSTGEILDSSLEKHLKQLGKAFGSDKVDWLTELRNIGGPEEAKVPWTKLVSRIRKRVQHRSQRDHRKAVGTLKSSIAHLLDHEGNVSAYDATCFKLHAGAIVQKKNEATRESKKNVMQLRCADTQVVAHDCTATQGSSCAVRD